MVYGGTIRAGRLGGAKLDIVSAFQSYGEYLAGTIDEPRRQAIVKTAAREPAPAAACTRPTPWRRPSRPWACRCLTAPAGRPFPRKEDECRRAGEAI
jgi:dihydroxy-acid dehydratase